jgi:Cdc6-like AAA superfamily ATPase
VREGAGFAPASTETWRTASTLLQGDVVSPNDVRRVVESVAQQRELVVFVDEFDRLQDQQARALFADTIKTLSDRVVRVTIVLIGVADSVRELIHEHGSVERALVQVHMPRMTRDELAEIVNRGIESARMATGSDAVRKITTLSQGLPHYTQLLSQLAAQSALAQRRATVSARDVDVAVGRALERAQQSVVEAYEDATADTRRSIYPQVLLACALAPENDYGLFTPADVREPLSRILGKELRTTEFARHLERLSDTARGKVLQKHGAGRTSRFRFVNPLLQPYVAMRGVSEGVVTVKDLA